MDGFEGLGADGEVTNAVLIKTREVEGAEQVTAGLSKDGAIGRLEGQRRTSCGICVAPDELDIGS